MCPDFTPGGLENTSLGAKAMLDAPLTFSVSRHFAREVATDTGVYSEGA